VRSHYKARRDRAILDVWLPSVFLAAEALQYAEVILIWLHECLWATCLSIGLGTKGGIVLNWGLPLTSSTSVANALVTLNISSDLRLLNQASFGLGHNTVVYTRLSGRSNGNPLIPNYSVESALGNFTLETRNNYRPHFVHQRHSLLSTRPFF